MSIEQKLQTLLQIKLNKYRAQGNKHPEVAAQYAVTDILNIYKHSPDIELLLDMEIEDAARV